jgi:outer membrane protein assembly factor BamB
MNRWILGAFILVSSAGYLRAGDWEQFRGGVALGHTQAARLPLTWSNTHNLAWRVPLPGAGWSQPVVVGGRIFVTTAVTGGNDRPKGMSAGAWDMSTMGWASPPATPVQWRVLAIDPADGRVLWSRTVVNMSPTFGKHASNTFATETPCGSATAVYAFFGATGTLVSLDHEGHERWRRDFGPQKIQNSFGTGSSPALHGDRLVLQLYNETDARLVCLDADTGKDVWEAARGKGTSWSTPIIWDHRGTLEVVAAGHESVIAYALADGAEQWRLGGFDTSFACSVVADADGVYMGTSSPGSRAPAAAIAPGSRGDLTLPKGQASTAAVRWWRTKSGASMPSPVVVGERLYFFGNTAVCLDKRTGADVYRKRLPGGTLTVASPLVAGDRIYVINERGHATVLRSGAEYEILAESDIGQPGEIFWATPAVAGDALLIRSSDALYCVRQ